MTNCLRSGLPLWTAGACLGVAGASAALAVAPVACELRFREEFGLVRLTAIVRASAATDGSYRMTLVRQGRGGSARSESTGRVQLSGSGEQVVSEQRINLPEGAAAEARLQVMIGGSPPVECVATLRGGIEG